MKQLNKHHTDGLSLVFGVVFLVAVGWWLVGGEVSVRGTGLGWIVAAVLIVFGVLGLLGALRGDRSRRGPDEED